MTMLWKDMSRDQRIEAVKEERALNLSYAEIAAIHRTSADAVSWVVRTYIPELTRAYSNQLRPTPSIVTPIAAARRVSDPLFVRRAKTSVAWDDRGPVPSAASPMPFGKTEGNVCLCFLPGEPNTSAGLVCANPVSPGRHNKVCDSCAEWFYSKAALVVMKRRAVA